MSPNARRRRRRSLLTVEAMERRELLSAAPILMTDGGLASQPTWGQTPTPPDDLPHAVNSFFSPESVITKDINGNPIDFNKDGYADLLETGQAERFVGYGTQTAMSNTARPRNVRQGRLRRPQRPGLFRQRRQSSRLGDCSNDWRSDGRRGPERRRLSGHPHDRVE